MSSVLAFNLPILEVTGYALRASPGGYEGFAGSVEGSGSRPYEDVWSWCFPSGGDTGLSLAPSAFRQLQGIMMLFLPPWEVVAGLLAASFLNAGPVAGSSINVALEASFPSPPFLLELLETAALENSTSYFPLLDRIADGYFLDFSTDQELYSAFLKTLKDDGHMVDPDALSSFELALSLHAAAPRIEAHYQYYDTSVVPSLMVAQDAACPVWVHFNGKQYCSPTLERAQQDFTGSAHAKELPFDRVLSLNSALPLSTIYADINSPLFGQFHQTLSATARSGRTSYRIRYRPPPSERNPLVVSGYGVELALKRTDYIVIDDRDADKNLKESKESAEEAGSVNLQAEEMTDLKPLSASELLGLGFKASSFVMSNEKPFETLLKVSQDFPKHSSAISKLNASEDFIAEHGHNREVFLPAGYNGVWMNGMQIDARQMDAYALLDRLRYERDLIGSLKGIGLTGPEAISLLSHPAIALSKTQGELLRYDYRDELEGGNVIIWLNDLEKDKRYQDWSPLLTTLLQRTYPGQLPTVKRDIHNLLMPLDFTELNDVELLVETLQNFVKRKVPIRIGIVPLLKSEEAIKQAKIAYYLLDTYGLGSVLAYFEESVKGRKVPTFNQAKFEATIKDRNVRRDRIIQELPAILDGQEFKLRLVSSGKYLKRLGADGESPVFFVNGAVSPRNDAWLQILSSRVDVDLRTIQRQVFEETVSEDTWLAGQFLDGSITHRNALIIPEDESNIKVLDIGKLVKRNENIYNGLPRLVANTDALKQFWAHIILVADLDTDAGSKLVVEAMEFRNQQVEAEITIIHNPSEHSNSNLRSAKLFDLDFGRDELTPDAILETLTGQSTSHVDPNQPHEMAKAFWEGMQPFTKLLGFKPGQQGVLLNGRVVGPIPEGTDFTSEDFQLLLNYERSKRLTPANTAVTALNLEDRLESPLAAAKVSSLIALSSISDTPEGIFETTSSTRVDTFHGLKSSHSAIFTGDNSTASLQIVASVDPTSEVAQRWIPILKVISQLSGVHMKLFLNPRERMQELPVKRFYRYVLDTKPLFTEDGALSNFRATFDSLPKEALLNLALDVPPAWLVSPKDTIHDLDNIKLSTLKDGANINAIYKLDYILIEGHSRDLTLGSPPRGVQLLLGTEKNPNFADTLIMANLGYFQFKASPGYYNIRLQSGRSQHIFNIDSAGSQGFNPQSGDETTDIALISFQGKTLFPRLSRKPGQESEDVLEEGHSAMDYVSKAGKFASAVLSNVGVKTKSEHADINIFSVASGHLYERMLNIMMVSVMRHTRHSVKFWFIEQFLSPSFKTSVPILATAYNFDYEMVTYKWPHWLRAQKEKQREIWGYKILFLDVLFPLSLDKVIFVDADQIVRTDMYSLVTHDLKGAPYGFTPMCDSRTEMEGFRFWKQGYWKSFLRGLPYHISALYVVDLKKFRQIAAGDRLRQQYHQLSADPASLSNLDQDLPNHMQMALPIHSLPQEWLWCETWCSDEALKEAKTIDLCNNPLTKEPKLERARRQVPEWTVYDDEIAGVLEKAKRVGEVVGGVGEEAEVEAEADEAGVEETKKRIIDEL